MPAVVLVFCLRCQFLIQKFLKVAGAFGECIGQLIRCADFLRPLACKILNQFGDLFWRVFLWPRHAVCKHRRMDKMYPLHHSLIPPNPQESNVVGDDKVVGKFGILGNLRGLLNAEKVLANLFGFDIADDAAVFFQDEIRCAFSVFVHVRFLYNLDVVRNKIAHKLVERGAVRMLTFLPAFPNCVKVFQIVFE